MDAFETLKCLSQYGSFEEDRLDDACPLGENPKPASATGHYNLEHIPEITRAKKSAGEIRLLKTVLTSACERNCNYCCFRAGRDFRRATLKPDEMAQVFHQMHISGIAEGLFLSSGVAGGGVCTQDRLIDTADILRQKYTYRGYLHLKIMPGAEKDQILRAMQLADRISINLEAPNPHRLEALAPRKTFLEELLQPLRWAAEIRLSLPSNLGFNRRWPSLATQFVVGSVGETDLELLQISEYLFQKLNLARVYYSHFTPVADTPFENLPPENPLRSLRLYQAGFLLRDYGYSMEEMDFTAGGNLLLNIDPKLAWARKHLLTAPLEVNTADRFQLLRVPGFGPKGVAAILKTRRQNPIKELGDLRRLGIKPDRALDFILLNGKHPVQQLRLL
jgi:predicted DNA-binding helix-hairpin-helix protein